MDFCNINLKSNVRLKYGYQELPHNVVDVFSFHLARGKNYEYNPIYIDISLSFVMSLGFFISEYWKKPYMVT